MQGSLALQLRHAVAEYLAHRLSLTQFLDQFMDIADDAEEDADALLLGLVDTIKLYWAEYTSGDFTEEKFRQLLWPIVDTYTVTVPLHTHEAAASAVTFSASTTTPAQVAIQVLRYGNQSQSGLGPITGRGRPEATAVSYAEALTVVDKSQRNTTQELVFQG